MKNTPIARRLCDTASSCHKMLVSSQLADVEIRAGRDGDGEQLIALIGACFAEYPGCILDVDGEMPELRMIATSFATQRGCFWVAEHAGLLVGSVGIVPATDQRGTELRKLYVTSTMRRRGLGTALCDLVEAEARRRRAAFVDLWSDTRFVDAHRLYERRGYVRGPDTRALHDLSHTVEYYYRKRLA
jgi:putative acetyltransferase